MERRIEPKQPLAKARVAYRPRIRLLAKRCSDAQRGLSPAVSFEVILARRGLGAMRRKPLQSER